MMKNKRGWIRIMEAVVAILLLTGVLLVVYSRQNNKPDISQAVYDLQLNILDKIVNNDTLRAEVLSESQEDRDKINLMIRMEIPYGFDYDFQVCLINDPCNTDSVVQKEIFVEDKIIGGSVNGVYSLKKIRLFIWEK